MNNFQKARLACKHDPNYRLVNMFLYTGTLWYAKTEFFWSLQRKPEGSRRWHHVEGTACADERGIMIPINRSYSGHTMTKIWPEDRK